MSSLMTSMAPTPVGGAYADVENAAKNAYNNSLIKLNNQRQGTLRNYGYNANFDPTTGKVSGLTVDSSNPYGQLQQTLRNQSMEDDQARDEAVGRGLHGGLANQASTDLAYNHQGQSSQLASNLLGTLDDYAGQQQEASQTYNNTLYQDQLDNTRNAILQQMFNTPDYSNLPYDPYSDPNTLPPDPAKYLKGALATLPGLGSGGGTNSGSPTAAARNKVVSKVVKLSQPKTNTGGLRATGPSGPIKPNKKR